MTPDEEESEESDSEEDLEDEEEEASTDDDEEEASTDDDEEEGDDAGDPDDTDDETRPQYCVVTRRFLGHMMAGNCESLNAYGTLVLAAQKRMCQWLWRRLNNNWHYSTLPRY